MYPKHLLPRPDYRIIGSDHFANNDGLVLIRHIESTDVKFIDGTDILHPDCIKFQSGQLRDLSTNLLGIFQPQDIFYCIQKEVREELCDLWNEGSIVRKIKPEEFYIDERRKAFFIPIMALLNYDLGEIQMQKWHFEVFHTPTNCNFWHISIRVLNEDHHEVSQIDEIKENKKKRIWRSIRDFMIADIIKTTEPSYVEIPVDSYN